MPSPRLAGILASMVALGGCATLPPAPTAQRGVPSDWSNGAAIRDAAATDERWWERLGDSVVDQLVSRSLDDNPTLAEAVARVDQARALLDNVRAARTPRIDVTGSGVYGQQNLGTVGGVNAVTTTAASISPSVSWELDLWGRVRGQIQAAQDRLTARSADARATRLAIVAQTATGVLNLRACNYSLGIRARDIASRRSELKLAQTQLSFGAIAPVEVATARTNLASAETDQIAQREQCARETDALVAVSGVDALAIRGLLPAPHMMDDREPGASLDRSDQAPIIPAAPVIEPVVPAIVLLHQPSVVAAEREAAARWAEITVAKGERLPRIDLVAILTGQWIRALGMSTSFTTWSVGPQVSGTVFDAGAGAANVRNTAARYREAVATLQGALRTSVREIEDGLAAAQSAEQRLVTSREAVEAARFSLTASEARRRAGAISQFELEEARRQYNRAQESAIAAARDHANAWVELVRASGNGFALPDPLSAPSGTEQ